MMKRYFFGLFYMIFQVYQDSCTSKFSPELVSSTLTRIGNLLDDIEGEIGAVQAIDFSDLTSRKDALVKLLTDTIDLHKNSKALDCKTDNLSDNVELVKKTIESFETAIGCTVGDADCSATANGVLSGLKDRYDAAKTSFEGVTNLDDLYDFVGLCPLPSSCDAPLFLSI